MKLVKDCINETVEEYKFNCVLEHPESPTFSSNDQLLFETLTSFKFVVKLSLMQHGRKKTKIRLKIF